MHYIDFDEPDAKFFIVFKKALIRPSKWRLRKSLGQASAIVQPLARPQSSPILENSIENLVILSDARASLSIIYQQSTVQPFSFAATNSFSAEIASEGSMNGGSISKSPGGCRSSRDMTPEKPSPK